MLLNHLAHNQFIYCRKNRGLISEMDIASEKCNSPAY